MLLDLVWGGLETLLGVITACLPLLQPSLALLFGKDSRLRSLLRFSMHSSGDKSNDKKSESSSWHVRERRAPRHSDYPEERSMKEFRRLHQDSMELEGV